MNLYSAKTQVASRRFISAIIQKIKTIRLRKWFGDSRKEKLPFIRKKHLTEQGLGRGSRLPYVCGDCLTFGASLKWPQVELHVLLELHFFWLTWF